MNDVCVFLGPTLSVAAARAELDAVYLPPVSQGDVHQLWRLRPRAIGIIDGLFDRVPAVWHKEIMWIMERGVHVFGSAGMGALRAVELEMFGMRGIGWVYQAFKDGALDRDDEVAVAYGSGPSGYQRLSEAMVNIRRTLRAAEDGKIISRATCHVLTLAAKALFWQDRNWPDLLERGKAEGADFAELIALAQWLPEGRVDQMAGDALAMLREMRNFLASDPPPAQVRWRLANTTMWDAARHESAIPVGGGADSGLPVETVMDEIRLLGPALCEKEAFEHLLENLRVRGEYERFVGRAKNKADYLRRRDLQEATPATLGRSENEVLQWYFTGRLGQAIPEAMASYARSSGFRDEMALRRAIWHEFCYVTGRGRPDQGGGA